MYFVNMGDKSMLLRKFPWMLCLGILGFALPPQGMRATIASPLPMAPTAEQRQEVPGHSQTAPQKITRLIIRGNRQVPTATLRALISTRPGDKYEPSQVDRDVSALKNTGYFDDVRAVAEDDPRTKEGKVITFTVREKKDLVLGKQP